MLNYRLLFFFLSGIILFSCQRGKKEEGTQTEGTFSEFVTFYTRFHEDSLYQLEHIIFPLEGLPGDADSSTLATGQFRWERENWVIHRPFDLSESGFSQELIPYTDDLIVERIIHHTGQYGMERRFAEMGGEWYLIYYAGMNRITSPAPQNEDVRIEGGFER